MDERCIHELIVDQCDLCRPRPAVAADPFDELPKRGPWFRAAFSQACDECGDWLDAGDWIRADGAGGYIGECCGEPTS